MVFLSDKSQVNRIFQLAWLENTFDRLIPVSAWLHLTNLLLDYLIHISVDSFLSVISYKLCLERVMSKKKSEPQLTFPKYLQYHVFGSFDLFPVFSYYSHCK